MPTRTAIEGDLFEDDYEAVVRLIMYHDNVHRKNKDFVKQSLFKSKFADCVVKMISLLEHEEKRQIIGDQQIEINSSEDLASNFSKTNCKYYVNYHDEKMCTVEFSVKFHSTLRIIKSLPDDVLKELHLDIQTPVGSVQV